ncbi:hypothetical protein DINM_007125 [Dirofilaria immitis]|nr:hypothetical protein [Dirofilaria immitis]
MLKYRSRSCKSYQLLCLYAPDEGDYSGDLKTDLEMVQMILINNIILSRCDPEVPSLKGRKKSQFLSRLKKINDIRFSLILRLLAKFLEVLLEHKNYKRKQISAYVY